MELNKKIFLAGHNGMVGKAIFSKLKEANFNNLIVRDKKQLNLLSQDHVRMFFMENKPDIVILAAAKVGGINANNSYPADFIYENLMIQLNVIHSAHSVGVERLLFLGSSCIYPKLAEQPIHENELLNGYLESTNEPYAVSKIAGIKLCESYNRQFNHDFRSIMPTNLYGPHDNFDLKNGHVIPSLFNRLHTAKIDNKPEVEIWGSGKPFREFLHVDDLADASLHILNLSKSSYWKETKSNISHINIGNGEEVTISVLVELMRNIVGYNGKINYNNSMPDGTPRKLLDTKRLEALGWSFKIGLEQGLRSTYKWFCENQNNLRS
jgi:GDP-L-fucose synthase